MNRKSKEAPPQQVWAMTLWAVRPIKLWEEKRAKRKVEDVLTTQMMLTIPAGAVRLSLDEARDCGAALAQVLGYDSAGVKLIQVEETP